MSAAATCINCGIPICANCTQAVGPKSACLKCADTVQARMAAAPPPAANAPYTAPTPAWAASKPSVDTGEIGRVIGGLGLGFVAGAIGSSIILTILHSVHFMISYLYVLVGYGVGIAMHSVTGRGGFKLAFGGAFVMCLGLLVGHFVYAGEMIHDLTVDDPTSPTIPLWDAFLLIMPTFSVFHWICIAIGVGACFKGIASQPE